MYANGDAAAMAQAWTAAQQQMWSNWLQMMQSSPSVGAEQWQKLMRQSMQTWLDNAEPTAQRAAAQMLNSQQAALNFLQMAASAWEEIAKQLADGDEWRGVLDDYTRRLRTEMNAGAGQWAQWAEQMAQTPQQWQAYGQPWAQIWQQAGTAFAGGSDPSFGMMGDLVSRTFDVYQQTFGRFLETPPLGYAREYEEKSRTLTKVLQEFAVANAEYQATMGDAWANGFTKLMEALVARAREGNPIRTIQELSDEWATIADPAFYEVFVGEKYVRAQGKLLTATMNYRIAQRQLVEIMARALDMPTRTEVDAAHKSIYEQRREVRGLKKALNEAHAKISALEAAVADLQATAAAPTTPPKVDEATAAQATATKTSRDETSPDETSAKTSAKKSSTRKRSTTRGSKSSTATEKSEG